MIDVKVGGQDILGFDFYVAKSEKEKSTYLIQKALKQYKLSLMSISTSEEEKLLRTSKII